LPVPRLERTSRVRAWAAPEHDMTAKSTSKKKAVKKKAGKSASRKATPKKKVTAKKKTKAKAPARKKASASSKTAKKKTKAKATKARTTRAAASGKSGAKPARGRASKAKRKPAAKKARRRPPLNIRGFRRKLMRLQGELLQAYINAKGDSRSRESDGTEDYIDYAVSSYDREFLLSLTELEQHRLNLVDKALKRIEGGGFGLCTQCERPIPTKRLEVQPWAQYCVRCQELADSGLAEERFGSPPEDDDEEAFDDLDEVEAEDQEDDETPDESRLISG
jgi:DnaK suppressor protein